MISFGSYIKDKRKQLGIPQRKIASCLDIDTSTLSKIEKGDRKVSVIMLKPLADNLNLKLEEVEYNFIRDFFSNEFEEMNHLKTNLSKLIKEL